MIGALIAEIGVETVIVGAGHDQMAGVDRPAEPFDAVVRTVMDLHIIDRRAAADTGQRDAVQLIAGRNLKAGIADLNIAQPAAIIVGARTAIEAGRAFDL